LRWRDFLCTCKINRKMADVEMRLIARQDEYINSIREAMDANSRMYREAKEGAQQERRYIEDIRRSIDQLRTARQQASGTKEQEAYNKKIREANLHLKEAEGNLKQYERAQTQANKASKEGTTATNLLKGAFTKLLGAVGGTIAIYKAYQRVIASTKHTADMLAISKAGLTAQVDVLAKSIATLDFQGLGERMRTARDAARAYAAAMNEIGDEYRALSVTERTYQQRLSELQTDMRDMTLSERERTEAVEEYRRIRGEIIDEHIRISQKEKDVTAEMVAAKIGLRGEELLDFISNYNKTRDVREEALEFQKKIDEEEARLTRAWTNTNVTAYGRVTSVNQEEIDKRLAAFREEQAQRNDDLSQFTTEQLEIYLDYLRKYGSATDDELDLAAQALEKHLQANAMRAQDDQMLVRIQSRLHNEREQAARQAEQERISHYNQFREEMAKLEDQAEQERIARLEGLDRIHAEEQYALKQLEQLRESLEARFDLEQEHYETLRVLRDNIEQDFAQQRDDYHADLLQQRAAQRQREVQQELSHQQEITELYRQIELAEADMMDQTGLLRLQVLRRQKQEEIALLEMAGDEISLLRARLLETELAEIEAQITEARQVTEAGWRDYTDALQVAYQEITSVLNSIFSQQVNHWARERSLLDTRISETQRAIQQEIEINKQGYASNIEAQKEALATLERQREEALRKEEEAIKRQQQLDTLLQTTSLITASANIYKSLSPLGPPGIVAAIATIATMFGAFMRAKQQAQQAVQLSEGGSGEETGMITGRKHSQGGERFLDHVEVERGEHWGVLSANKAPRYANDFHAMVDAMNRGVYKPGAQIAVPASGQRPATARELVQIRDGIYRLVRHSEAQEQTTYGEGFRVVKKGNITRRING